MLGKESLKQIISKILLAAAIVGLYVGCSGKVVNGNSSSNSSSAKDNYKLPSGREIKITGMNEMNFENGETGLVLNYQTDIPIENLDELKKEVEEVWTIFRVDVEKAKTTTGIIRATHITDDGMFVKNGKGYGFICRRDAKGQWALTDDKK